MGRSGCWRRTRRSRAAERWAVFRRRRWRGRVSDASRSSTATTWSPAICTGNSCSRKRTPKQRCPRRRRRRGGSRASTHPCACRPAVADLTPANVEDLLGGADLILDGTDNFEARYLINDFAVSRGIPWIYGAAVAAYGLTMPVIPGRTACLRCVYPEPPSGAQPTCETAGVLNAIVSAVASLQVADALRILTTGEVRARITTIDVWDGIIRQVEGPARDPDCPCCARREFPHLEERERPPVSLCGRNAVQVRGAGPLDLAALAKRLERWHRCAPTSTRYVRSSAVTTSPFSPTAVRSSREPAIPGSRAACTRATSDRRVTFVDSTCHRNQHRNRPRHRDHPGAGRPHGLRRHAQSRGRRRGDLGHRRRRGIAGHRGAARCR